MPLIRATLFYTRLDGQLYKQQVRTGIVNVEDANILGYCTARREQKGERGVGSRCIARIVTPY